MSVTLMAVLSLVIVVSSVISWRQGSTSPGHFAAMVWLAGALFALTALELPDVIELPLGLSALAAVIVVHRDMRDRARSRGWWARKPP